MKKLCTLVLMMTFALLLRAQQQTSSIAGKITTADNQPGAYVTIALKEVKKVTVSDEAGMFRINKLKPGSYTLLISLTGYESVEKQVQVSENKATDLAIQLEISNQQLQEVIVTAARNRARQSNYVAKMPLKNLENPQVYNTVSAEILKQQVITNYDDGLKNVPGIQRLWESTGRGFDGASYFTMRGFEAQASFINGLPGLTNGNLDPANIERIEVIKGPSATLFGSSGYSYGGLINNVTKKPYDYFAGELTYTAGSFGLNRYAADINLPLNKEKGILARINTAYQNENSFQDNGFRKSLFFAPTVSYKVNDKLSFLFVSEFISEEKTNPVMLFLTRSTALQYKDLKDLNYNNKLSFTSNDLTIKNPGFNFQAQMMYKLSNAWTSQTVFSRGKAQAKGYYTYINDNINGNKDFSLMVSRINDETTTTDIQQNFIGDFKLGKFRNRIVAGLDYFDRKNTSFSAQWSRIHSINAQGEINYADPKNISDTLAPVYLIKESINSLLGTKPSNAYAIANSAYSAYVSDVLNITPELLIMASLRADRYVDKGYKQTVLSPKFGFIYQPLQDKVTVFANYMNGFRNIGPMPVSDDPVNGSNKYVKSFKPEQANQLEFGIKTNLLADMITSNISFYNIEVSNISMPDPKNQFKTIQGGKSRSRGIEVDINANPFTGFNILAAYSYNDSKVLVGEKDNIWLEQGKRPIWAGSKNLFNTWATYHFEKGKLKGFGLGAGINYVGDNATLNNNVTGVFMLPAYTLVNTSIFYNADKFRFTLNVNNIGNKEYYGGGWSTVNPQKPRNLAASFAYRF